MARFNLERDIQFFKGIASELVDEVIETLVVIYKLAPSKTQTNLYGESLSKVYYEGLQCSSLIDRQETSVRYEGFGPDTTQLVDFMFNRFKLESIGIKPEIGDIIYHNGAYFEINNIREDQLIGGQTINNFSLICQTFMTRVSSLQIIE